VEDQTDRNVEMAAKKTLDRNSLTLRKHIMYARWHELPKKKKKAKKKR